jgi:hypothetical protein
MNLIDGVVALWATSFVVVLGLMAFEGSDDRSDRRD